MMSVGAEVISGSYGALDIDGKRGESEKNEVRVEDEGSGRDKKSVPAQAGGRSVYVSPGNSAPSRELVP